MTTPKVSVLIDAYNYGRYVEEAIDSVLGQEFPKEELEILVVDDGSTDDTADRVKKYGTQIRYLYKENGGQASAFNYGFRNARGEIIALLDADDYFLPGKLTRIVEEFRRFPDAGLVYHGRLELDSRTGDLAKAATIPVTGFLPEEASKLFAYVMYPTSCLSFRQAYLRRVTPIPETIRIQADIWVSLLVPLVAPVVGLVEPLCVYRIHGRNLYHRSAQRSPEQKKVGSEMNGTVLREIREWLEEHASEVDRRTSRSLLQHYVLVRKQEEFLTYPPSRFAFLRFLLYENYVHRSVQTWKFTAFNWISAFAALVFGYERADSMYQWRLRALHTLEGLLRFR